MVRCPRCNSNNRIDVAFCGSCGEKLPLTLVRLLQENSLQAYAHVLQRNHIDTIAELAALEDGDLAELGIATGDRIRLRQALDQSGTTMTRLHSSAQAIGFAEVGSQARQLFSTLGQAVGETLPVKAANEKHWAIGMRLSGLAGFLFNGANIIAPLGLWLWKRKESRLLESTGKEVLNFQLSFFAYGIAAPILDSLITTNVRDTDEIFLGIVGLTWLGFTAYGVYQAFKGLEFRYPFIFRPIK